MGAGGATVGDDVEGRVPVPELLWLPPDVTVPVVPVPVDPLPVAVVLWLPLLVEMLEMLEMVSMVDTLERVVVDDCAPVPVPGFVVVMLVVG